MKKQKFQLTKENVLKALPIRNPMLTWFENDKGEVVISVPQKKKLGILPAKDKIFILDSNGKEMWHLCNGKKTVKEIITILSEKLSLDKDTAEKNVLQYLTQLLYKGIFGLRLLDKDNA